MEGDKEHPIFSNAQRFLYQAKMKYFNIQDLTSSFAHFLLTRPFPLNAIITGVTFQDPHTICC